METLIKIIVVIALLAGWSGFVYHMGVKSGSAKVHKEAIEIGIGVFQPDENGYPIFIFRKGK